MAAFDVIALRSICANYFESRTVQVLQEIQQAQERLTAQLQELSLAVERKADVAGVPTLASFEELVSEVAGQALREHAPTTTQLEHLTARLERKADARAVPTLAQFHELEAEVQRKANSRDVAPLAQLQKLTATVQRKPSAAQLQELQAEVERKVDAHLVPTLAQVQELSTTLGRKADASSVVTVAQLQKVAAALERKADKEEVGEMEQLRKMAGELERKANTSEVPTVAQLEEHASVVERKLAFLAAKVQKIADAREKEKMCQPFFWYASPVMAASWDDTSTQNVRPCTAQPLNLHTPEVHQQGAWGAVGTGVAPATLTQHQLQQQQHLPQQMQEPASREAEAVQSAPPASSSQAGRQPYVPPHLPNTVPTIKDVEHVDPVTVQELVQSQKCILVDLRGEDRASGLIEGAVHEPAIDTVPFTTKVPLLVSKWANQSFVVFTCQYSAHRAPQCANWYRERADPRQRVGILSGGFRGWEAMGLPVQNPADGENAKAADEVAVNLGTKFVEGCLAGVPGGGFCMPTSQPAKPQPAAQAPQQPVAQPLVPQQRQAAGGGQRSYVPPHLPNTVPVIENVETLDPRAVLELLQSRSCLLVDLRGEDRAAGLIEGAVHEPAIDAVPFPTKVPRLVQQWADQALVIFTCQYSAHRAPQCANWYRQKASPQQRVAILSGGFRGWEATGLPVLSLASPEQGHAADEAAKQLGTQFAGGCVARVPGGGFSIPGK
mmetsp:Transcript_21474/g.65007  ORF Transcript_21474/g.65007 Transcript_21474/m.65007 type:complete len:724 (+) Transcript_21474:45-2216(+)